MDQGPCAFFDLLKKCKSSNILFVGSGFFCELDPDPAFLVGRIRPGFFELDPELKARVQSRAERSKYSIILRSKVAALDV